MDNGHFSVGTSGWGYREWRGPFYPSDLPASAHLTHYAGHFNAVEANSTFYGLPPAATVERWRSALPAGFAMALKAPQTITHRARLRGCGALVREFTGCARVLEEHVGPLLFQLPPTLKADAGLLREFLAEARASADGLQMAFEFRDPGWYCDEVFAVLDAAGATCCVHDMPGSEFTTPRGAPLLYLRRHGTAGKYAGAYGAERLAPDADLIAASLAAGWSVHAFFNNTADGAALADAGLLRALVEERRAVTAG